jgi:hypothetical protein
MSTELPLIMLLLLNKKHSESSKIISSFNGTDVLSKLIPRTPKFGSKLPVADEQPAIITP